MKTTSLFQMFVGLVLTLSVGFYPAQVLAGSPAFVVKNLNDSGMGSLRQAMLDAYALPGENVIIFTISGSINLVTALPPVGDHLVIDGGSHEITLSGGDLVRLLEIQPGVNLQLVNLTLAHGDFDYGGAVYNQGSLRVENCRFTHNHADTGAAIYNAGELVISDSLFEDNFAQTGGGAIWNRPEGSMDIRASAFRNNRVDYDFGGAIYNLGEALIDGTEISGNIAQNVGGGIINWNKLELTDSQVLNNAAKLGGGVDNTLRGVAVIRNTAIAGNTSWHWGGGINNDGQMTVYSSQVLDNRGMEFAGGMYNSGVLELVDSQISNNRGSQTSPNPEFILGGGIYNQNSLTLTNSFVEYNSAMQGGGIYNSSHGNLTIRDDSQVNHNNASGENGGAGIYNQGILNASQSTFDQNVANSVYGGGIFNESAGIVNLNDCQVTNNRVYMAGGGVYNLGEFSMLRSRLAGNLAYDMGGGIFSLGKTTISDSSIDDNTSWNWGGGIYSSGELHVSGSAITRNVSWTGGGMLTGQNARMVNSTVSGNYASGNGGGIENYGNFEITYSTIANNTVETGTGEGGGINNLGNMSIGFSLVANNFGIGNCYGNFTITGLNLSNDNSCAGFVVADPRLGSLQDNGGPTLTHALLDGSPAIDAADNTNCPATDQRGRTRPAGLGCDLGAYEASVVSLSIDINPKTTTNLIDATSNSAIPVVIFSTPAFNAPQKIVQTSLTFGMTGWENSLLLLPPLNRPVCSAADINGDRLLDLVCHFKIKAAGFTCQATRGILHANLLDGTQAVGSDTVKITRCP